MESRDFVYWMMGFLEINELNKGSDQSLTPDQVKCIKRHLDLVFAHEIDPSYGDKKHQEKLNTIHNKQAFDPNKTILRC